MAWGLAQVRGIMSRGKAREVAIGESSTQLLVWWVSRPLPGRHCSSRLQPTNEGAGDDRDMGCSDEYPETCGVD